jgi:hypothetical protein
MPFDASTLIGGPAIVTLDSAVYYTEDDIEVSVKRTTRDRSVSAFGMLGKTLLDVVVEIKFRPAQFRNLDKMLPYLGTARGTRIFGNTDKACVIQSITEGLKYTWSRCAVTTMPNLNLGVSKQTLLGDMVITALKANATNLHAANSIVAQASQSFSDTSFDPAYIFNAPYIITYGADPYDALDSGEGVEVSWDLKLARVETDQGGLVDMRLDDLGAKASFEVRGLTHAQWLTLQKMQGTGVRRGAFMGPTLSEDLVIAGLNAGEPKVTLKKAFPDEDTVTRFSATREAPGRMTFTASRRITTGAAAEIAVVETVSA